MLEPCLYHKCWHLMHSSHRMSQVSEPSLLTPLLPSPPCQLPQSGSGASAESPTIFGNLAHSLMAPGVLRAYILPGFNLALHALEW
mmetsp:Transcript_7043/g.20598  ORF Transcript_7043/g.20598 Transcript_7043/m.20598 type:complete len:86 (+) Transcript_7043:461-718(+)